jgi:hypothetical protein
MFRDRNIVLIGMPENSPSIDRLLSNGSFRVVYDETLQKETIAGPTATYVTQNEGGGMMQSYGLVTVLRGQGVQGAQHRIAISSHSSARWASEFMSSPAPPRLPTGCQQGHSASPPPDGGPLPSKNVVPLSEEYETHTF